jgi:hypothetical protein
MKLDELTNRLQGAIAACLTGEGLVFLFVTATYSPRNSYLKEVMIAQALLGVWLFAKKNALVIALICKGYLGPIKVKGEQ